MNGERLFEALTAVGDDLIVMAENKRFVSPWRKWGQAAAVIAVVVCLGALAVSRLPTGLEGAKETASPTLTMESAVEETEECVEYAAEETVAEETIAEECYDAVTDKSEAEGAAEDLRAEPMTKIVCRGTFYYIQEDVKIEGVPPLGEELSPVTDSDDYSLVGCRVFTVPHATWYGNYAVNGEPVTDQIYVQTLSGYLYGTTYNEKVVSRYTIDDVRLAVNKGNYEWLAETFVQPIETAGGVDFMDSSELTFEELNTMFFASTVMNTGVVVADMWIDDKTGEYVVPISDVHWRLYRFLDGGYDYKPEETELYDEVRDALVCPVAKVKYDRVDITVHAAEVIEENKLFLLISLPEQKGVTKEYIIRFDGGSWRYETIHEPA